VISRPSINERRCNWRRRFETIDKRGKRKEERGKRKEERGKRKDKGSTLTLSLSLRERNPSIETSSVFGPVAI
jgi:hypothetical protein